MTPYALYKLTRDLNAVYRPVAEFQANQVMADRMRHADSNIDKRPQLGPWAPGNYYNTCAHCQTQFLGDKRARMCAPCAYGDSDGDFMEMES